MKKLESPLVVNQTKYKYNKITNNFNFKLEVKIDLLTEIKRIVKDIFKLFK